MIDRGDIRQAIDRLRQRELHCRALVMVVRAWLTA